MVEFTVINLEAAIARLKMDAATILEKAHQGMLRGVELFSAYFIKTYLSLPKPAGYDKMSPQEKKNTHPGDGLYTQTGQLRNSWTVRDNAGVIRLSTASSYGIYHDKHFPDIAVRIPKRINIYGEFNTTGAEMIKDQIIKSVGNIIKRV